MAEPSRSTVCCILLLAVVFFAPLASANDPFLRHTVTVQVVQQAGAAVVNITTERINQRRNSLRPGFSDPFFNQFFRDFFEPRLPRTSHSLGSGVVIDAAGHILTNEHVVARASRIRVALADGREYDAELIGADPNNDIAVLKVDTEEELPWISLGSSSDLMVGEPVIAIGNPFGLSNTVTTGVISALNRSLRSKNHTYHGFLQTDASINPGNSGGPLLNAEGDLIAINTAVYQGGQGIGFAIPIDVATRVVRELIEHGEITPVWLGIEFQDLTPDLLSALNLDPNLRGALVNRVRKKSPADAAGVRRSDIVTHFDQRPVRSARMFFEILETVTSGQELGVGIHRDGKKITLEIIAMEVPDELVDGLPLELMGLDLALREGGGFEVRNVRQGGGAARIGLQAGDILIGINGRTLDGTEALRRAMLDLRGRSRALVLVQRGNGRYHVTIPLV